MQAHVCFRFARFVFFTNSLENRSYVTVSVCNSQWSFFNLHQFPNVCMCWQTIKSLFIPDSLTNGFGS
jgi:hypothetical protein